MHCVACGAMGKMICADCWSRTSLNQKRKFWKISSFGHKWNKALEDWCSESFGFYAPQSDAALASLNQGDIHVHQDSEGSAGQPQGEDGGHPIRGPILRPGVEDAGQRCPTPRPWEAPADAILRRQNSGPSV